MMRTVLFGALLAFGLAASPLTSKPAAALPLVAPAGLNAAADELNVTEKIGCRAVWRCNPWGCGWRRVCWAPRYSSWGPGWGPRYAYWGGPRYWNGGWGYRRAYWGGPRYYGGWGGGWGPRRVYWGGPRYYGWRGGWGPRRVYWGGPRYYGWRGGWGGPRWGWGGSRVVVYRSW
jgi:hypothetical protein